MNVQHAAQSCGSAPFAELFDGVDDLIKRVADAESPEILKLRAKVRVALADAKSAVGRGGLAHTQAAPAAQSTHAPESVGAAVNEYPLQALNVALLMGVGFCLTIALDPAGSY